MIPMFAHVSIETMSNCNRKCASCIRNSYPDKSKTHNLFENVYLPLDIVRLISNQLVQMHYGGSICLSHYNEPLMDYRIAYVSEIVKEITKCDIYLHTNGDFIDGDMADQLDGKIDKIIVSLYMEDPVKSSRGKMIQSLFRKTKVDILWDSVHIPTHFSPLYDVKNLAELHRDRPCIQPRLTLIINHEGRYLFCCDDLTNEFELPKFVDIGIKDFWFSGKHSEMVEKLNESGGRSFHPYCYSCPRG